ncbi:hypothetical protein DUI87_05609 [Hirundo rustica rustica]|uniref:Uncharacterized protein n=1 Tax=Hirundo rustica rustica TaxID=333673 RepID=A0A3M0L4N8_HIRRU|nr:hypothetical protein DUI87_05609 [Hirundo rustica rustica]
MRGKQHGNTKVSGEGGGGGAPGARDKIPLQAVVMTMVKQVVPLQPMRIHRDAEIHLQPMRIHRDAEIHLQPVGEVPMPKWVGALEEVVSLWETQWREWALLPGWSSLSLEDCTSWKSDPHCSSFGRAVCPWEGLMLQQVPGICCL